MNSVVSTNQSSSIELNLNLQRQSFHLDVNIELPNSGITAIFGASGCGKTTLLRCIAGLENPDSGYIRVGEKHWLTDHEAIAVEKRSVGYVFQHSQLFPHLTVEQNLLFSNKVTQQPVDQSELEALIELLDIQKLLKQYPNTLSGGERQRVAIARALLRKPSMLLLDEPLASLDEQRKNKILGYLIQLKQRLTIPIIYVTHSQEEVAKLADHILIMQNGKVQSQGAIEEIIDKLAPLSEMREEPFVVWFGKLAESKEESIDCIRCGDLDIRLAGGSTIQSADCRLRLYAKDVSIATVAVQGSSILNIFEMQIMAMDDLVGSHQVLITLQHGTQCLLAKISSFSMQHLNLQIGMDVYAQIKAVSILT
jgi:molybdate transport system ATP-binding protein